jgi:anti-sigma factor RsiW
MDCREFAARHAAFIDDTLPGFRMVAMREHLTECARCARRDAEVRRALFLLKNLPAVRVSHGFEDRLRARISAEGPVFQGQKSPSPGFLKWAAASALLLALVGVRSWTSKPGQDLEPTRLPAVFASTPLDAFGYSVGDESAPEYVASMSTGIPMWPALMLAEEGSLRFAGIQAASLDASRPQD